MNRYFTVVFDDNRKDETTIAAFEKVGSHISMLSCYYGDDAIELFIKLTQQQSNNKEK